MMHEPEKLIIPEADCGRHLMSGPGMVDVGARLVMPRSRRAAWEPGAWMPPPQHRETRRQKDNSGRLGIRTKLVV